MNEGESDSCVVSYPRNVALKSARSSASIDSECSISTDSDQLYCDLQPLLLDDSASVIPPRKHKVSERSSGFSEKDSSFEFEDSSRGRRNWFRALQAISRKNKDSFEEFNLTDLPTESAYRYRYSAFSKTWRKDDVRVKLDPVSFGQGAMRKCFRMKKLSNFSHSQDWNRDSNNYVAKRYINEDKVSRDTYFDDVKLQMEAKLWGEEYNRHNPPKKVDIFMMTVIEMKDRPGSPLFHVEHFLGCGKYVKYNSNSGFVEHSANRNTPHAFSHFTFERSAHEIMVVDIQGIGDLYTDPQIHTASGCEYGDGNLGVRGVALFFRSHTCNSICKTLGLSKFDLSNEEKMTLTKPSTSSNVDVKEAKVAPNNAKQEKVQAISSNNQKRNETVCRGMEIGLYRNPLSTHHQLSPRIASCSLSIDERGGSSPSPGSGGQPPPRWRFSSGGAAAGVFERLRTMSSSESITRSAAAYVNHVNIIDGVIPEHAMSESDNHQYEGGSVNKLRVSIRHSLSGGGQNDMTGTGGGGVTATTEGDVFTPSSSISSSLPRSRHLTSFSSTDSGLESTTFHDLIQCPDLNRPSNVDDILDYWSVDDPAVHILGAVHMQFVECLITNRMSLDAEDTDRQKILNEMHNPLESREVCRTILFHLECAAKCGIVSACADLGRICFNLPNHTLPDDIVNTLAVDGGGGEGEDHKCPNDPMSSRTSLLKSIGFVYLLRAAEYNHRPSMVFVAETYLNGVDFIFGEYEQSEMSVLDVLSNVTKCSNDALSTVFENQSESVVESTPATKNERVTRCNLEMSLYWFERISALDERRDEEMCSAADTVDDIDEYNKAFDGCRKDQDDYALSLVETPPHLIKARQAEIWLKATPEGEEEDGGEFEGASCAARAKSKVSRPYHDPTRAGELYTEAADLATKAMKGKLAARYYMKAEETYALCSD